MKFYSEKEYLLLDAKEQKKYDEAINEFIDNFRKTQPNGKTIKFEVLRLALPNNNTDKYAIVVRAAEFSPKVTNGTSAFTYKAAQIERLAQTAGLPSSSVLYACIAASIEPLHIEMTIRPVKKDEEYTKANGTVGKYKIASMRYENETMLLSNDSKDLIAQSATSLIKDEMRNAFRTTRKVSVVEEEEMVNP